MNIARAASRVGCAGSTSRLHQLGAVGHCTSLGQWGAVRHLAAQAPSRGLSCSSVSRSRSKHSRSDAPDALNTGGDPSRGLSCSPVSRSRSRDAPDAVATAGHSIARGECGRTRRSVTRSCLGSEGKGKGKGKEGVAWKCVEGCGACCLLDKGPLAPPIDEILTDPSELEQYWSMVGEDGWCKLFDKSTRACTVYEDRPRFCRVEASVFEDLYGIPAKSLNRVARRFCIDSIGDVYGKASQEMHKFKGANPPS